MCSVYKPSLISKQTCDYYNRSETVSRCEFPRQSDRYQRSGFHFRNQETNVQNHPFGMGRRNDMSLKSLKLPKGLEDQLTRYSRNL